MAKNKKPKRELLQIGDEPEVKEPTKPATNEQVLKGESITIEECKKFIADCKKAKREDYVIIADRSWDEIEKRNKNGKLYGGQDLYKIRRWTRFPLWWSCWKIRQPIVFARLPEPVLKDTQGDDPIGRTACVIGERFMKSILKTFDCYSEFSSCADDFLVTNWAWGRWFYKIDSCYEEERVRLEIVQPEPQPVQMDEMGQPIPQPPMPPILVDPRTGEQVSPDENILEDEKGPYLLTGEDVIVENEEVYFQSQLYSAIYIEPDIRKYSEVTRLAYEYHYSFRDFKEKFGQEGLSKITLNEVDEHRTGKPIIVYEYWDKILKECRWFAESSEDFFQPTDIYQNTTYRNDTDDLKEVKEVDKSYDNSDLYGLSGFFPSTEPLAFNQSTKTIWPTPEFFQVQDIIDDINSIVSRLVLLTKAIRIRFLYDSTVPELTSLISEAGEAGALGVPNLQAQLIQGKGTLQTLVQYLPVEEMINGVNNMYQAFAQRLDMFYQITGISDLIRGQTNPDSDKTYGERQMEGQYALNRIEPYQSKMQEWIKDNYLLGMEMGLKLFSPETIDDYIVPETLDPEDKERYEPALALLKANKRRRFRVEFGTDSTFNQNREWKKNEVVATANATTKMMESIAGIAETNPQLAAAELKIAKNVISELYDGKLYLDEVTAAIQSAIDVASQPKNEPPDPAAMKVQVDMARLEFDKAAKASTDQLEVLKIQSTERIELAKMQQTERLTALETQITQFKVNADNYTRQLQISQDSQAEFAKIQKDYQELAAEINAVNQELEIKRNELMIEVKKVTTADEAKKFELMLAARTQQYQEQLSAAQLELDKTTQMLQEKEKWVTEMRLQAEHQRSEVTEKFDNLNKLLDVALKQKELSAPIETPKLEAPKPKKKKRKESTIIRDKEGNIEKIVSEAGKSRVMRDKEGNIAKIIHEDEEGEE